jgi:hypothetical protein
MEIIIVELHYISLYQLDPGLLKLIFVFWKEFAKKWKHFPSFGK